MKNLCFLLPVALFIALSSFTTIDWTEYFNKEGARISYRYQDCNDVANGIHQQKVIFKFENTGTRKIEVTFNKQPNYGKPSHASANENKCSLTLNAGQTITGDCNSKDKSLYLFAKHLNMSGSELKSFELKNITVKPIE